MLINKPGDEFMYDGNTYRVGDVIIGSDKSEYAGLIGSILEIRDGSDKETENDTPDIYCSFDPPVLPADIAKVDGIGRRFLSARLVSHTRRFFRADAAVRR